MRGWNIWPIKPGAEIAVFSLLFFGTIMYLHWEAMLISYLATRVTVLPFNNVPEIRVDKSSGIDFDHSSGKIRTYRD